MFLYKFIFIRKIENHFFNFYNKKYIFKKIIIINITCKMAQNITIIIYYNNIKDESQSKSYIYDINTKIIDIKKQVFEDYPKDGYNYIDINYVSERIYKEIGKYSFNHGIFPRTMDNTKLSNYTNGNKTYHFFIHYDNYNIINETNDNKRKINLSFIKREEDEDGSNNDIPKNNLFDKDTYDTNFPPLGKIK
jgi:hypothetical protein